jgi:uncharacterized protein
MTFAVVSLIIPEVRQRLKAATTDEHSGHDWWHIHRVAATAVEIANQEQADVQLVELAALLHDIADWKFHGGSELAGPAAAKALLNELNAAPDVINSVCEIIAGVTFKGAKVDTPMLTIEGKCVQDADRLDAIGAVGIARAFAFGGHFGRKMYDPDEAPVLHTSFEAYKKSGSHTLNHFYEKLLLLKGRMQTETGRELATQRHAVMVNFLKQFYAEAQLPVPSVLQHLT